jgi:hypothetical protein
MNHLILLTESVSTYSTTEVNINTSDIGVIVFCIFIVAIIAIGFARRIKKEGVKEVINDEAISEVKKILQNQLSDILTGIGFTEDYETFKNAMLYEALSRVRAYIDKKGGLVDTITDEISDDTVLELINEALKLSGMEDDVKKAYDSLITQRIKQIEAAEDEAAASVDEEGYSTEEVDDSADHTDVEMKDIVAEPTEVETDDTDV